MRGAPRAFYAASQALVDTGLHAAWLGHSTVLLKIDGFTILTDPILGARCGVRMGRDGGPAPAGGAAVSRAHCRTSI